MVQQWVNLPAKDKMSPPKYQGIGKDMIKKVTLPKESGSIGVIAGNYQGVGGAASTFTPMNLFNAKLKKGTTAPFSFPSRFNSALLVIEGRIKVNDTEEVPTDNLLLFANEGEDFIVEALEDTVVLVLSGEPIEEPIAAHGPFVMNTKAEILQAFEDVRNGNFGHLED